MDIVKYVEMRLHEINKDITDIDVDIQGNKVRCLYRGKELRASLDRFGKIGEDLFYNNVRDLMITTINEGFSGKLPKSLNRYVLVKLDKDDQPVDIMGVSYMANNGHRVIDKDEPRYISSSDDMGYLYLESDGTKLKVYDKHTMPESIYEALIKLGKIKVDHKHRSINKYK